MGSTGPARQTSARSVLDFGAHAALVELHYNAVRRAIVIDWTSEGV